MRPVAFGSAVSPSLRAQLCAANARAHARTYARTCTCAHARTHVCTHACTHARMHAHARARTHARTYARTCTCAHTCTCAIYIPHWRAHAIAVCPNSGAHRVPQLAGLHRLGCTSINSCAALRCAARYPVAARVRDCPAPSSDARRSACWASSAQPMRQKMRARGSLGYTIAFLPQRVVDVRDVIFAIR